MNKKLFGAILFLAAFSLLAAFSASAVITQCGNGTNTSMNWYYYDDGGTYSNVTEGNVCINATDYDVAPNSNVYCDFGVNCVTGACILDTTYFGYVGNDTSDCSPLATVFGQTTTSAGYRINTTINLTGTAVCTAYEDQTSGTPVYTTCTNAYTRNGTSGYCDGTGLNATGTVHVTAGNVCVNGNNTAVNSTLNCGTWGQCVQGATTADNYYVGYAGAGTDCSATNWVSAGTVQTAPTDYRWSATVNTATCPTENAALQNGCASTRVIIFAAFALLAVGIIVLAAFALIKFGDGASLMTIVIAAIGLAIVLFVGYVVIATIQIGICGV